jgi:hypothetical protein
VLNMGLFHSFGFVYSYMPVLVASILLGSVICDEGTIVCLDLIVISLKGKKNHVATVYRNYILTV